MERRWRRGEAPFDGVTLAPEAWVPLPLLSRMVSSVVGTLRREHPGPLHTLLDWHEHDGWLTAATPVTWGELAAAIERPEAWTHTFAGGDTWVYRAYFPEDRSFYVRFYASNEDGPAAGEWSGTFDLTGPSELVESVLNRLRQDEDVPLRVFPPHAYFNERYAG